MPSKSEPYWPVMPVITAKCLKITDLKTSRMRILMSSNESVILPELVWHAGKHWVEYFSFFFYFLLPFLMYIVTFSTAAIVRQSAGLQQMAILNPDTKLLLGVFLAIMVLSTMEAVTWPF